jgi:hypothetical protein
MVFYNVPFSCAYSFNLWVFTMNKEKEVTEYEIIGDLVQLALIFVVVLFL